MVQIEITMSVQANASNLIAVYCDRQKKRVPRTKYPQLLQVYSDDYLIITLRPLTM